MKYYSKENEVFKEYTLLKVNSQRDVEVIVRKLCRHYKYRPIPVTFTKRRPDSGSFRYTCKGGFPTRLNFHKSVFSIEVICHEVAHYFDFMKDRYRVKAHTKKHWTWLKRLLKYCEKKDYWNMVTKMVVKEG